MKWKPYSAYKGSGVILAVPIFSQFRPSIRLTDNLTHT